MTDPAPVEDWLDQRTLDERTADPTDTYTLARFIVDVYDDLSSTPPLDIGLVLKTTEIVVIPLLNEIISCRRRIDGMNASTARLLEYWRGQVGFRDSVITEVRARHYAWGPYCLICDPEDHNNPECPHEPRTCVLCKDHTWPCETARIVA